MKADIVGRRYASALISIGRKDGQMERYGQELSQALSVLGQEKVWRSFLSPLFPTEAKKGIVGDVAKRSGWTETVTNFLRLLIDKKRLVILPQIAAAYRDLEDEAKGRLRAKVESAVPLDEGTLARLSENLSSRFGSEVILEPMVEPKVFGGVRTTVRSTVIDGTIQGRLARLREILKQG